MSEQSCTDPMVAQDSQQGEIELEPTQSAEVVLHKAKVSRSNVNHAPGNGELETLEVEAREANRGLWVDPAPVPPWEWRKRKQ